MPSPEQLLQPPLPKAAHPEQGEQQTDVGTSPQMERVVTQLATAYGVDLSQQGANLSLDMPDRPDRWMIANLDGQRLSLTRCFVATKTAGWRLIWIWSLRSRLVVWSPLKLFMHPRFGKTMRKLHKQRNSR